MAIQSAKYSTSSNGSDKATFSPSRNPNIASEQPIQYDGVIVRKTLGGKTFTVATHNDSRLTRKLSYSNLTAADKAKLEALFNQVKGQLNSFFYSEDDFSTATEVRFVNNKLNISEVAYNAFNVDIEIEEQL